MQGLTEGINGLALILRVLEILGFVVGLAVLLSYFLFKTLGSKWLETKFQERLERFRHAQNRELEELRLKINTLFDRTTRLHQREFEVMPEAWAKLNDAFYKTMALVSPFQQYPDLAHMSTEHFSEFVDSCHLGSWEKNELKGLSVQERNSYYIDHVYWPRLVDTRNIVRDAHVYLMKNGIFLRPEIKDRFTIAKPLITDGHWWWTLAIMGV
jgi:hypothetical protein